MKDKCLKSLRCAKEETWTKWSYPDLTILLTYLILGPWEIYENGFGSSTEKKVFVHASKPIQIYSDVEINWSSKKAVCPNGIYSGCGVFFSDGSR